MWAGRILRRILGKPILPWTERRHVDVSSLTEKSMPGRAWQGNPLYHRKCFNHYNIESQSCGCFVTLLTSASDGTKSQVLSYIKEILKGL